METFTQPKIIGYRQLNEEEVALMNEGKELANRVREYVEKLSTAPNLNHRWISIGKTDLQKGFMALMRAIVRPTSF